METGLDESTELSRTGERREAVQAKSSRARRAQAIDFSKSATSDETTSKS